MKIDLKSILILIFLGVSILFAYKWYFSNDIVSKERVKQLEKEFKYLEEQKKIVDSEITSLKLKFYELKKIDDKLKLELIEQEKLTKHAELEAKKSKSNLDKVKKDLEETRKKIENIKRNPPNRIGDALLESLKNKTKR